MAGKPPNGADIEVGERIRAFRKNANLTQTELATQIGVTFQQLQKYEKGANRVGASRLLLIAGALDVPISAFFDGLTRPTSKRRPNKTERIAELSAIPAASKLLTAFSAVSDQGIQAEILKLVRILRTSRRRKQN